jgi:CheY-like chemotaxis protein
MSAEHREQVLVVDDDIDTLDSYRDLLLLQVADDVRCAQSASAAEEVLAGGFSPTAILLDLLVAGGRGEAFAVRLKGDPTYRRVPIIAISGDVRALRSLGPTVDRGLLKPADPTQILEAIRELCRKARRSRRDGSPDHPKPPG